MLFITTLLVVRNQRILAAWNARQAENSRRVVEFDKVADAFDVSAFSLLPAIAVPAGEALPRLEGSEQLVSNLLTVTGFAPRIQSAPTPCRERADAWERMRSNHAFESGFLLSGGRIHTLASLEDGPLAVLRDGPVTSVPTGGWADSDDQDVQRRFVSLLDFTARAAHYEELFFRRWAGQWYLEINPTYHFTIDGRRDSYYDAEYVAKIKRMERNSAVYQLVRVWADYSTGPTWTSTRRR